MIQGLNLILLAAEAAESGELLLRYLTIILSVLGILSALVTIYTLVFKGAKKNMEQDNRIQILEDDMTELKTGVKDIRNEMIPMTLDIREIKTVLKLTEKK